MAFEKRVYCTFLVFWMTVGMMSQSATDIVSLKVPLSGKWEYACAVQNRKSPFRGMKKVGRALLGKNVGSALIGKSEADEIDWVIPPQYDAASKEFSEQLAAVEVYGKVAQKLDSFAVEIGRTVKLLPPLNGRFDKA